MAPGYQLLVRQLLYSGCMAHRCSGYDVVGRKWEPWVHYGFTGLSTFVLCRHFLKFGVFSSIFRLTSSALGSSYCGQKVAPSTAAAALDPSGTGQRGNTILWDERNIESRMKPPYICSNAQGLSGLERLREGLNPPVFWFRTVESTRTDYEELEIPDFSRGEQPPQN